MPQMKHYQKYLKNICISTQTEFQIHKGSIMSTDLLTRAPWTEANFGPINYHRDSLKPKSISEIFLSVPSAN